MAEPVSNFKADNMAIEVWCLHRPAGYLSEILNIEGYLDCNAGNICSRHTVILWF